MEAKIFIISTMKFEREGNVKSRLGYFFCDSSNFSDRENFRGFTELGQFSDDDRFFKMIPADFIGQTCIVEISEKPNPTNPMKSIREFTKITCEKNGKAIYLV